MPPDSPNSPAKSSPPPANSLFAEVPFTWPWQGYRRKLRIWATNYGRDGGWFVELQGQTIAVLTECRFEDMFWDSYQIQAVTVDLELQERIQTPDFWTAAEADELVWRSREFGEVASAVPADFPLQVTGRLLVRGLFVTLNAPSLWDQLVMFVVGRG